jgi:CRP/FNR family transcriptional regulator, cyclic AMP receptor protein
MTSFMAQLSSGERDELYRSGRKVSYQSGETLMREGERGEYVLVIDSGDVEVVKSGVDGKDHLLNICGTGELLGEIACVEENGRRSASVVARTSVAGIKIAKDAFVGFLLGHPALFLGVVRRVTELLRAAEGQADRASVRVLRAIVTLADRYPHRTRGTIVPFTQRVIAGYARVSAVTAQRVLKDLKRRKLASSRHGKGVVVPCLRCLRAAADTVMSTQKYGENIIGCGGTGDCPQK